MFPMMCCIDLFATALLTIELAISEPCARRSLSSVGATGMVGGYALKHPAVGSATSIGRQLLSTRIREAGVTIAASLY
jgi:hypothetical protein